MKDKIFVVTLVLNVANSEKDTKRFNIVSFIPKKATNAQDAISEAMDFVKEKFKHVTMIGTQTLEITQEMFKIKEPDKNIN